MNPSRRGLLYVPGDDPRKIEKARGLGADCVCLDLEDGVAEAGKDAARKMVAEALLAGGFGDSELVVRINPLAGARGEGDLSAILGSASNLGSGAIAGPRKSSSVVVPPGAILLPKVGSAEDVRRLSGRLAAAEAEHAWPPGRILILALIESARALVDLRAIADADPRLAALVFGAEDFAADAGIRRSPDCREFLYARQSIVAHAAAFGLQAIDLVHVEYRDIEGLAMSSRESSDMGFSGRQLIHPAQVGSAQEAYSPSSGALDRARRLVAAFEAAERTGKGAFVFEGSMVDMPLLRQARNILARAEAAGGRRG